MAAPGAPAMPAVMPPAIPSVMPPMPGMPPVQAAQPAYQYHIAVQNQTYGPFDLSQLRQMLAEGRINLQTLAWREGWPNWTALQQHPELQSLAAPAASSTPPPLP